MFPPQDWGQFKTGDEHIDPVDHRTIAQVVANPPERLWIVKNAAPDVAQPDLKPLDRVYRVVSHRKYDGSIEVTLLERR